MNHINHPDHYQFEDGTYEAINVIEAWGLDFSLGNAVKYIARAGRKGDTVEDLKKAIWYLERRIQHESGTINTAGKPKKNRTASISAYSCTNPSEEV